MDSIDLDAASVVVTNAALDAARHEAAALVIDWLRASGIAHSDAQPQDVVDIFLRQDPNDARYQVLSAFEKQWSVLVAQLTERACRPGPHSPDALAVNDARERNVTWQAIADALHITAQSAHTRYKTGQHRGGRRGPARQHKT